MADMFTIELDTAALDTALGATAPTVQKATLVVSEATAASIATDARARVARRTGLLAASIDVRPARDGTGYWVGASRPGRPMVGRWLEFGTRFMTPRPFLLNSAKLAAAGYPSRVGVAVQDGIDAVGLGD